MNEVIISTIIAGIFTLAGIFYQRRSDKSRIANETEKIKADVAKQYQDMLSAEIVARRKFEKRMRARMFALEKWATQLSSQVIKLGGTPVEFKEPVETD